MTFALGILVGVLGTLLLSLVASIVLMKIARPVDSFAVRTYQAEQGVSYADSLSRTSAKENAVRS